jgi:F1F0 ATPase subunit 2
MALDASAMTGLSSTAPTFALQAASWLCGGALLGAAYFWALRWSVELFASGRRAPLLAAGLQAGRFLLLAGLLAVIADRCGALPLLSAAAGILVARTITTTRLRVPT